MPDTLLVLADGADAAAGAIRQAADAAQALIRPNLHMARRRRAVVGTMGPIDRSRDAVVASAQQASERLAS